MPRSPRYARADLESNLSSLRWLSPSFAAVAASYAEECKSVIASLKKKKKRGKKKDKKGAGAAGVRKW